MQWLGSGGAQAVGRRPGRSRVDPMTSPVAVLLIAPIRFYQRFITPYTPASCRHYPTCSTYAVSALRTRGALVGTALTIWRVLRCNPWNAGGIDYVPPKGHWRNRERDSRPRAGAPQQYAPTGDAGLEIGHAGKHRERDETVASSTTVCTAEHRSPETCGADTDLDAPRSAASTPMIGRSAA